ncbi:MAG: 30S ribosomal protein S4 [Nitrospirota bacterium]|nr:MAG: 30S ribosomal protein S4 [Nitrospirota bacterium]
MARYRDAKCKQCRREGEKLFLKGDRCLTDKCGVERRKYPPGQHGQRGGKMSDYGIQLRAKQNVRRTYGVLERQFRKYFYEADKKKGVTGEILLQFLELRLDNIVYRMGFSSSRDQARQIVTHKHVTVNGRSVNIPSFRVKPGDVVEIREKSRKIPVITESIESAERRGVSEWLEVDASKFSGKILSVPSRDEIPVPVQEQLIVELYSK